MLMSVAPGGWRIFSDVGRAIYPVCDPIIRSAPTINMISKPNCTAISIFETPEKYNNVFCFFLIRKISSDCLCVKKRLGKERRVLSPRLSLRCSFRLHFCSGFLDECLYARCELCREDGVRDTGNFHAKQSINHWRITDESALDGLLRESIHSYLQVMESYFTAHHESHWVKPRIEMIVSEEVSEVVEKAG
ncbi:MAG: hypothetical protein Greene101415_982 [Parcubacteria group bacterium Greene1014_15]|nr:MAG: hypothetical protein Greene101415_982 [Parcubacteria group bacterium Greene1014_15]